MYVDFLFIMLFLDTYIMFKIECIITLYFKDKLKHHLLGHRRRCRHHSHHRHHLHHLIIIIIKSSKRQQEQQQQQLRILTLPIVILQSRIPL